MLDGSQFAIVGMKSNELLAPEVDLWNNPIVGIGAVKRKMAIL